MGCRIEKILAVPTTGSFYYEDVTALQKTKIPTEDRYTAKAITAGFTTVRERAEAISLGLVLSNGEIAWGDCISVSYGGKAGRAPLFRHATGMEEIQKNIPPLLVGKDVENYRTLAESIPEHLHPAIRYGVSQALLSAVSIVKKLTMAEVICEEWQLPLIKEAIPLQGSCGNDRYANPDKMIAHRLPVLPHSQVDDIEEQVGSQGEKLLAYASYLRKRTEELGGPSYQPVIHLDVHGSLAQIFNRDISKLADFLAEMKERVSPLSLRMESVAVLETKEATISFLKTLRQTLKDRGVPIELVADEWANTYEDIVEFARSGAVDRIHIKMPDLGSISKTIQAVIDVKPTGTKVLLGGSCIETNLSTKVSVHVALATQPHVFLAKPGMGIDEAIMLCENEMKQTLAILRELR